MNRFRNLLIAIGGGLLLWAAWPVSPFTLLIFVAWIPLLWLEDKIQSRKKFFGLTYVTMLTWNVATTWWIWNASEPGALAAFLANSLLMCFPWLGYKIVKKWRGEKIGYVALVSFWMCFEYVHLQDWGLSWPWLTLGNVFATQPQWIQWYEFTGSSGGSLWVMAINILLFLHLRKNVITRSSKTYKYIVVAIFLLIVPILLSRLFVPKINAASESNVVIVQPNIDPYEKISTGSLEAQLHKLIHLSEQETDSHTALVLWPETAIYLENGIDEERLKENFFLNPLWGFLRRHPKLSLFTGIESYRTFKEKQTSTARPMGVDGYYFDSYNGSVLLDSSGTLGFYHKSMLVPGVETLPWFLKFIDKWFEKFGGTTAGYAKQNERTVLATPQGYKIAPAICYESIYGGFMAEYFRNGANLICIITNDGWWKNTPGHKQHMNYARLRAIETRTWVARCANTGISCFIDPGGVIHDPRGWDQTGAIKLPVPVSEITRKTFFVKHGELLSKAMTLISIGLIVWIVVLWSMKKFSNKELLSIHRGSTDDRNQ